MHINNLRNAFALSTIVSACLSAADGTVVGWGSLVDPTDNVSPSDYSYIATIPTDLGDVVEIAAGLRFALALRSDGTVRAWGDNADGACDVPAGLSDVVAVRAGDRHAVVLRSNGQVVTWGKWWDHADDGTWTDNLANTPSGLPLCIDIDANWDTSGGLDAEGRPWVWGSGAQDVPSTTPMGWRSISVYANDNYIAGQPWHFLSTAAGRRLGNPPDIWGKPGSTDYAIPIGITTVSDIRFLGGASLATIDTTTHLVAAWGQPDTFVSFVEGHGPYLQLPVHMVYSEIARTPSLTIEAHNTNYPGLSWVFTPPTGLQNVRDFAIVLGGHLALSSTTAPPARLVWLHDPSEAVPSGTVLGHVLVTGDEGNSSGLALISGSDDTDNADVVLDGHLIRAAHDLPAVASRNIRIGSTESPVACGETAVAQRTVHGAPTLTSHHVAAGTAVGSTIGSLLIAGHAWNSASPYATFALVAGAGDTDNAQVSISQGDLLVAQVPSASQSQWSIRIRTAFASGGTREDILLIQIDAPPSVTASSDKKSCGIGGSSAILCLLIACGFYRRRYQHHPA